nr:LysM peptidoglycan-binding domain-containing protein [Lacticaseibacillus thailandensis]
MTAALAIIPGAMFAQSSTIVDASSNAQQDVQVKVQTGDTLETLSEQYGVSLDDIAKANHIHLNKLTLASGSTLKIPEKGNKITPGTNKYNEAEKQLQAEAAAKAKAEAQAKAAAAAKAKAAADAAAKAQAAQQQQQASAQNTSTTSNTTTTTTTTTSGKSYGTFNLTFYDPAVLGSNMGYGGVAANLSVFPKGTHLKITLSDGTVWYRVVNDTGSFANSNSRQLDVAMPNDQVPSAGVLSATVEVVG